MFPIVEGSEDRLICGMKLGPYLDRKLKRDLYISEKHYLVSSKPDRKTKEWVDVLRTTINILLSFWL